MARSKTVKMPLPRTFEYPTAIVIGGVQDSGVFTFGSSMQRLFPKITETPFEYSEEDLEKDLQIISCLILNRLFELFERAQYEQFQVLEKALKSEFNVHEPSDMIGIVERINSKPNCKIILLKLWKNFGLKEFYESFWITNSYLGENLEQLIESIHEKRRKYYPKALFFQSRRVKSYFNEKIAFFSFYAYRKSFQYLNPESVVCFISLTSFNLLDGSHCNRLSDSKDLASEMMNYSYRHLASCKKILIFTKPDVLIRKLNRNIKYTRDLDHEIRPELEEIEQENVKLVINSIISELMKAVGEIDSYHIVNLTVDSELSQVCDFIYGKRSCNKPFISRCLIPFKIPTKILHFQKTGMLTDVLITLQQ